MSSSRSELLEKVAFDLCEVSVNCSSFDGSDDPDLLWAAVTHQIEFGDVRLKTVSHLELIHHLDLIRGRYKDGWIN